jgi:hypothetical protein
MKSMRDMADVAASAIAATAIIQGAGIQMETKNFKNFLFDTLNLNEMTEEIYSTILTDTDLQSKLVLILNKSYPTIRRWALDKSDRLTTIKAKAIIDEHFTGEFTVFMQMANEKLEQWKESLLNETETK